MTNTFQLNIGDETVKVPLTQGQFALIDAEDAEKVLQFKWFASHKPEYKNGGQFIAVRNITINGKRRIQRLHRFIMNAPNEMEVDHINHNTLDCRKANLRLATRSENMANCRLHNKNTSGFKGVSFQPSRNKFTAKIWHNGKQIHLGRFDTAEDAAKAYDKKAKELFGEFAKTNF